MPRHSAQRILGNDTAHDDAQRRTHDCGTVQPAEKMASAIAVR
jgi:hypothetical protein